MIPSVESGVQVLWIGGPALVVAFCSSLGNAQCPTSSALGIQVQEKGTFKPSCFFSDKKKPS